MNIEFMSRKIKAARILANKTQEEVAEQLKMALKTYIKYENNPNLLTTEKLYEIAKIVGQPITYFFVQ